MTDDLLHLHPVLEVTHCLNILLFWCTRLCFAVVKEHCRSYPHL